MPGVQSDDSEEPELETVQEYLSTKITVAVHHHIK